MNKGLNGWAAPRRRRGPCSGLIGDARPACAAGRAVFLAAVVLLSGCRSEQADPPRPEPSGTPADAVPQPAAPPASRPQPDPAAANSASAPNGRASSESAGRAPRRPAARTAPPRPVEEVSPPATGTAAIRGRVRFEGERPPAEMTAVAGDDYCMKRNPGHAVAPEATLVMGDGSLPNAFVYVKAGLQGSWPSPQTAVELNQINCVFIPHVFGVQVGQPLEVNNFDATIHNVHCQAEKNERFNLSQPKRGAHDVRVFDRPEIMIRIKCDVHPWMRAWCGVLDHPFFAVSAKDGTFELRGLPAGEYEIEAWHELWGRRSATVRVGADETREADFVFGSRS